MRKKFLKTLMCTLMIGGLLGTNVFAASPETLVNSIGSDASDPSAGKDTTQNKTTQYDDSTNTFNTTTGNKNNNVDVYATKAGHVTVAIPKTLILGADPKDDSKYKATYYVAVMGDIAGSQSVTVTPTSNGSLVERNGKTSKAQVSCNINNGASYTVHANDILDNVTAKANGTVTATGVTAGAWSTHLNIGIAVNNNPE